MISMQHISLIREQRRILDDISLDMSAGENWVILGRNGSGKTTLLEMMTGYMFPSSGLVEVLGQRYGQCDIREVRKSIGYISQSMVERLSLIDPVWEVVATGAFAFLRFYQAIPEDVRDRALSLLAEMKLDYLAEQPLGTVSQGERKKVLLARALMGDPKLLIMDEPCAGLDLYEREKMLAEVDRLKRRNVMVVYVTHHIEEIVPLFSHVALVREGRLVAAGRKEDVLTPELIKQTYHIDVELKWDDDRPWIRVLAGG
ncbi:MULTISPECIES: ABC transporter ATP-binding protein [Paenibacillus]|uniref:Molybdenum ABC transporter ATP-binding protein n=1 Tax=Paenibacillus campinasensis TaxID=66347 RepID=A0A268F1W2_9BACL|nr:MULTISPECIES: ATP-binding cassette domain-containing protein [Paenibacillus]PAD79349.1 molybdenum ABC transporter ATP-binding protein [Paenibacillus campinasensis]PAK51708.1 molybdenum ABC transporter ATP-binding protein [Paenibacillus sp. 7541]